VIIAPLRRPIACHPARFAPTSMTEAMGTDANASRFTAAVSAATQAFRRCGKSWRTEIRREMPPMTNVQTSFEPAFRWSFRSGTRLSGERSFRATW
jgi:hypothetical protein